MKDEKNYDDIIDYEWKKDSLKNRIFHFLL